MTCSIRVGAVSSFYRRGVNLTKNVSKKISQARIRARLFFDLFSEVLPITLRSWMFGGGMEAPAVSEMVATYWSAIA